MDPIKNERETTRVLTVTAITGGVVWKPDNQRRRAYVHMQAVRMQMCQLNSQSQKCLLVALFT